LAAWITATGSEQAPVLIVGGAGGSVPLYAIELALALGAPAVHYLDTDQQALALAAELGAQASEVHKGSFPRRLGPFAVTVLLELVAAGRLHPERITSRVTDWESAAEALSDPPRKLVLTRSL